ncbi:MAG: SusC/RagA family TonB-linked outer membrane protein [Bacteroidales bacterium]|nr:SusC/RagA family TonB-linked outer membrane protein [Bacteroidales bacterium]
MKFTILIQLICLTAFSATTLSQNSGISLRMENVKVKDVLGSIEDQSAYRFFYNDELSDVNRLVDLQVDNSDINEILTQLFNNTDIAYTILENNLIVVAPKRTIQQKVTGRVTDRSTGEPLPGVNVIIEGTGTGTVTDMNGSYSLDMPQQNAILHFSFVGYLTEKVVYTGQTTIDVSLIMDLTELEEIVVIGYGTLRKGDVTSSVASVKAEDFIQGSVKDIGQLVQGKVAGLTISSVSGDPTSNTQIKLRGNTTILGTSSNPLILIDGIQGDFNTVAPEDIESVDVLKDGSAAAIYGVRGTNGVIIITTKRAKGSYANMVEYSGYLSTQVIARKPELLTAEDYRAQIAEGTRSADLDLGASTDWIKEVTQTPVNHVHNLTFRGGNEKTNYLATVNYKALEGIIQKTDNDVLTARADINHNMFNDIVKINFGLLSRTNKYTTVADGYSFNGYTYRQALIRNPAAPIKDEEGNWHEQTNLFYYENPLSHIYESDGRNKSQYSRLSGTINVRPVKGLNLKAIISYARYNESRGYAESKQHYSNLARSLNGYASNGARESIDRVVELTAEYTNTIARHHFTLLGGYSYQDNDWFDYWMRNVDFPTDVFGYSNIDLGQGIQNADPQAGLGGTRNKTNLIGFFGRASYSYADKYLLLASLRYEAASQLVRTKDPWGLFPAVSVGWRLSNESFIKDLDIFNELKIRAGYGITGSAPNRLFNGLETIRYGDPVLVDGEYLLAIEPDRNSNPYLRWEEKAEINIGLDFAILDSRIGGTVDLYHRRITGLLWDIPVPVPPNLVGTTYGNAGEMTNKGIEILLNFVPVQKTDFYWESSINFSTNANKLLSLNSDIYENTVEFWKIGNSGEPIWDPTHLLEVDGKIGNFWGYKVVDVTEDGQWIYLDSLNNKVEYNDFERIDDNKHILGNGIPKYFVGWNNTFRYKNFDLSILMRGAFKFQILNRQRMYYENTSIEYYNRLSSAYDEVFGKAVLSKDMPLQYNSHYIEDGDYWKIDNITLGYNFKTNRLKFIKSARIYASSLNTLTITSYSGIDPEVSVTGLEPGNDARDKYPTTRTFTLGFNVNF